MQRPDVLCLGGFGPRTDNVSHPTGENQNGRGYGSETDECSVRIGRVDIDRAAWGE
jgi:hypothetical protein